MSVKLSDSQIQALQARVAELEADNQRLRQSESRYRQVFENAPIGKNRTDQEQARLLSTVAEVANQLLRASNYKAVLPEVVRLLGEATGCDRCAITQDFIDSTTHQFRVRLLHEWCRDEIPSALIISPGFEEGLEIDSPPSFRSQLLQGESVNFVVSEMSELSWQHFFEIHGNTAMLLVPVMLDGHCWGHIGFDNCGEPRLHDAAEVAILQVAAESIAAAIERQEKDDALRESEANFRTLFELSSEGIYYTEVDPPCPINLSVDEQCDWLYNNLRVVRANPALVAMYGIDHPDQLLGLMSADVHVGDSERNAAFIRSIVESGYCFRNLETEEIDFLGNPRFFLNGVIGIVEQGYFVGGWGTQTDVTELYQAQQTLRQAETARAAEQARNEILQQRDRLLNASATSVSALLTVEALDDAINRVLKTVGEALYTDRAGVVEFFDPEDSAASLPQWRLLYEWHTLDTPSQLADPTANQGTSDGIEDIYARLAQGDVFSAAIEDCSEPFRSQMATIGVKAMHYVPIF
ncbi:MAG: GAF domain-containing protein, partial [Cyanobacteria bacterium P01_F01_bin.3]